MGLVRLEDLIGGLWVGSWTSYSGEKAARVGEELRGPRGMGYGRSGCNDVGRRRRWWRWFPPAYRFLDARQGNQPPRPFPLTSSTPERPCRLNQPSLSLFLPIQSAQPPTICDPSRTRLVFRAHLRPLRYPLSVRHSRPHPEQLSGYELTELRSLCGGRASSYAAYWLQNVSDAWCLCIQGRTKYRQITYKGNIVLI